MSRGSLKCKNRTLLSNCKTKIYKRKYAFTNKESIGREKAIGVLTSSFKISIRNFFKRRYNIRILQTIMM